MLLFYFCIANIRKKIGLAKFASPILLFLTFIRYCYTVPLTVAIAPSESGTALSVTLPLSTI